MTVMKMAVWKWPSQQATDIVLIFSTSQLKVSSCLKTQPDIESENKFRQ
jgi:hypothetical protein